MFDCKARVLAGHLYISGMGNFYKDDIIDVNERDDFFDIYITDKLIERVVPVLADNSSVGVKSTEELVTQRPVGRPKKERNDILSDEDIL